MNISRIGNSVFFIGLLLLVTAAILWDASDAHATPLVIAIGLIALACIAGGGWLWNRPTPGQTSVPLSQQVPKQKIVAGIAGVVLLLALQVGDADIQAQFIAMFLIAYGLVGILEIFIDRRFPALKENWDAMGSWKKILISTAVIVLALVTFITLMRGIGLWLMSE